MSKTCIVIVGPTAVGKTAYAIELAKKLKTSIISADSRQCYNELDIGVAKPSISELQEIKHYFINSHSIVAEVNAAVFEQYSLAAVNEIFANNDVAVMVGGTGLYIDAFCNGLDEIPLILPEVRAGIMEKYKEMGMEWLQKQVVESDPEYYMTGEIFNPQRLMRALEVKKSTGRSIRSFQSRQIIKRDFDIIKIGLQLSKPDLTERINKRVDDMISNGLVEEVKALVPYRHHNALNTVGYKEIFACLDGQLLIGAAIELIKKNTRHYAKRQMTWFRRDALTTWTSPDDFTAVTNCLKQ